MIERTPSPPRRRVVAGWVAACIGILAFASTARAQEEWTTEDLVLDNRIDVDAQYALMRMMTPRDPRHHLAGSAILSAVKNGDIGGVYQADRGVPAQRARSVGSDWWKMIPKGFDATCYKVGSGAPIIVYRPGLGGTPERLDPALRSAWESCRIPAAEPRTYRVTIQKPPPPRPAPVPRLDPPPAAGLTVRVITTAGAPVGGATVETTDAVAGETGDTDASGTASFPAVPEGPVHIYVIGPNNCTDDTGQFEMGKEPLTVEFTLDCTVTTPPAAPGCDEDKFAEVFNECGNRVTLKYSRCTLGAYPAYLKCAARRDPVCVAKELGKLWSCGGGGLDGHKIEIRKCFQEANAAANCTKVAP